MNTNATIGIIVVLAIIIVGGFFLLGRDGTGNLPEITNKVPVPGSNVPEMVVIPTDTPIEPAATITYAASGFSPNPVTIKKGEMVTWKNESGREMWVASAMHPTHAVYPEKTDSDCLGSALDACVGIPNGDSWSFTFNTAGEWGYHDHLRSSNFGKVIVQ